MFLLVSTQYPIHIFVDVLRSLDLEDSELEWHRIVERRTNRCSQIKHRPSSNQGFLVVVLDVDIDDVHRLIELAATIKQILSVR